MKGHIAILLAVLILIAGCGQKATPEAAPQEPSAPAAPAEEPAVVPAEETTTTAPAQQVTDANQATVDRYTAACKAGNKGLCAALERQYGITVTPDSKSAEAAEPAEATE